MEVGLPVVSINRSQQMMLSEAEGSPSHDIDPLAVRVSDDDWSTVTGDGMGEPTDPPPPLKLVVLKSDTPSLGPTRCCLDIVSPLLESSYSPPASGSRTGLRKHASPLRT